MNSPSAKPSLTGLVAPDWNSAAMRRRMARRYRGNFWFQFMGLASILAALGLLALLIGSLMYTGASAFRQTHVTLEVFVDPTKIEGSDLMTADFRGMVKSALREMFPDVTGSEQRKLYGLPTQDAPYMLRDKVIDDPSLIGTRLKLKVPVSDPFDQLNKGLVDRKTPEEDRRVNDQEVAWFDALASQGRISLPLNLALILNADSRFPELAGLRGAIIGSFLTISICFLISFPLGIGTAVYLEEFAPKNRWTDLIEVNINNLAAVPSVVFGLLGLALFLGTFGLPRSSPLVGGLVLALLVLPTTIIAGRAALKAVPPSIREAALGVGASRHQSVMHHVLPLAMPGFMTGTIIGLAHALGETAPLLLIGMNAFLADPAVSITSPATLLPTQIYLWADSPERGFVSRTSAAILVLLAFLIFMNSLAIFLRSRFEKRW